MSKFNLKAAVVTGLLAASTLAFAQFSTGMTPDAVTAEVKARIARNESPAVIAAAAKAANIDAAQLASTLLSQGQDAATVIQDVIRAYGATDAVTIAVLGVANAAKVDKTIASNAAILAGANTNIVLTATAAGGGDAGNQGGGLGGGNNFGNTPRQSFSSGGSAASPS